LIASLLQFQKRARMTVQRDRGQFNRPLFLAQIRDHHALARSRSRCAFEVVEHPESDHGINLRRFREHVGTRLRQASGHNHAGIRIEPPRAPRDTQALRVGAIGDRAGVDDIDVGLLAELAAFHPARAKPRLDDRRIVLIDLASERCDREARCHSQFACSSAIARSINPPPSTSSPR
jgi:hypothetical protein